MSLSGPGDKTGRRVLVYRSRLLPFSETFIRAQVLALRDWQPLLVGEKFVPEGLPLDGIAVRLLVPQTAGSWRQFSYRAFRYVMLPDPMVLAGLRSLEVDLVHAHFGTSAIEIWPYARALRLPLLVTLHGHDICTSRAWWHSYPKGNRWRDYPERLARIALHPTVRFLAVSNAIKEKAIAFGLPEDKIQVSYIGIDVRKFVPVAVPVGARARRVLFVGRLVEKKGVRYLLEAFLIVQRHVSDAELVIVGDGPLREELEKHASAIGLKSAVFKGVLSSEEVVEEMNSSRVLCTPSITASNGDAEGFGLVLLEAQSSGLPVVTSASGGATEGVVDGVTGYSIREKDVEAMSERLMEILCNNELATAMGGAARRFVEANFSLLQCSARLEDQYSAALGAAVANRRTGRLAHL